VASTSAPVHPARYLTLFLVMLIGVYLLVFLTGDKHASPKLGIDLQGGTRVALTARSDKGTPDRDQLNEARKVIDGDEALITALMSEEVAIRDALVESEHVSVDAHDFPGRLARIRDMVVEHNRREEFDEFPLLNQRLDASERTRLTRAVEALGKLAASGTEAEFEHADLAAGSPNMMVGPFAAILDRARRLIAESSEDRP